jgi:hypothetical protein
LIIGLVTLIAHLYIVEPLFDPGIKILSMPQENCREAVFADYIWNQDMMTNSFNCTYCYKYYYPILDERNKTLCM